MRTQKFNHLFASNPPKIASFMGQSAKTGYGTAPGHWHRLTVLGALALSGLVCAMTVPAATDGPVCFGRFCKRS